MVASGWVVSDWKDVATITAILAFGVSAVTYVTNSYYQRRNLRVENLRRFFEAHDRLLEEGGFLMENLTALESDTFRSKTATPGSGPKFHKLMRDVEQVAYLTANNAVPTEVQVYLFGWFAQRLHPHIGEETRKNIFWEMAVHYIDELKKATDDYSKCATEERAKYLRKHRVAQSRFKASSS